MGYTYPRNPTYKMHIRYRILFKVTDIPLVYIHTYLLTVLGEHELSDGAVVGGKHFVQSPKQRLIRAGPLRLDVAHGQTCA